MTRERLQETQTDFIRERAAALVQFSNGLIHINEEVLFGSFLSSLRTFSLQEKQNPTQRKELSLEQGLGLDLFFNVVNFCYQDPETGKEYRYKSPENGTVMRSSGLRLAMKESGVSWNNLLNVSLLNPADFNRIAQIRINNPLYLGSQRVKRITGFAERLMGLGYIWVDQFIKDKDYDAGRLLSVLSSSGYFTDDFQKRSQVAVKAFDETLKSWGHEGIKKLEILTCMADYRIPQVFYNTGVMQLSDELKSVLESRQTLRSGSMEELVLRASVVVVGEMLSKKMGITEAEVDSLLWGLSQKMAKNGQMQIPHMIVATDKY